MSTPYADVPVFRFGSRELDELHADAWQTVCIVYRDGRTREAREIVWKYDGYRYIVDHGSHRTLNTMRYGAMSVQMEDLPCTEATPAS